MNFLIQNRKKLKNIYMNINGDDWSLQMMRIPRLYFEVTV